MSGQSHGRPISLQYCRLPSIRPVRGGARMLRPTGLNHLGLTVTDMDKTLHFYRVLGLEVLRTSGPDTEGGRSAVVKVGGQEINLFYRPGLVSIDHENPIGVHHFCLSMDAESI